MEKIKSLFSSHKKLTLGVVVLLALSLPFAVNQVMQRQDLQQGAQVAVPSISLKLLNVSPININQSITVSLALTTSTNDVGSIKLSIKYDPTMVTITEGTYPTNLQPFDKKKENGSFDLTLLNPTTTAVTGQDLQIVTFNVTGLKAGSTTLKVESVQATATGYQNFLTVDPPTFTVTFPITALGAVTPSTQLRTFDPNGGKNHCRPASLGCAAVLNETAVASANASCTTFLGLNGVMCTSSGFPTTLNSTNSDNLCSTLSAEGFVRYCIPNGAEVPSGWTARPSGDASCTTYNTTPSKCYVSPFLANGVPPPNTTATVTPLVTTTPTNTPTPSPTPTPIPTATSAPIATPIPGDTLLRIATYLPGIGNGAANLGLNSTPIHPQREGTLTILNTNSEVIKTVKGPIQYSSESGVYSGTFALGTTFPTGVYNIKLQMNNTLVKLYPSAMNIASGQNNSQTGANPTLIPGDLNSDNSLGVFDWTYMIACIKNEAACTSAIRLLADLNDNGSVDEKDVQILQRGFALRDGD